MVEGYAGEGDLVCAIVLSVCMYVKCELSCFNLALVCFAYNRYM